MLLDKPLLSTWEGATSNKAHPTHGQLKPDAVLCKEAAQGESQFRYGRCPCRWTSCGTPAPPGTTRGAPGDMDDEPVWGASARGCRRYWHRDAGGTGMWGAPCTESALSLLILSELPALRKQTQSEVSYTQ